MIKVTNAELLGAQPYVHALSKLTLDGMSLVEKATIRQKYATVFLRKFNEAVQDYETMRRELIERDGNTTYDDQGEPQAYTEKGIEEHKALLDVEVDLDVNPLKLPYLVYGQDDITVAYVRNDGTRRDVNETVIAVINAIGKFVEVTEAPEG